MAADVMAPGFWEIGAYKHNVKRIKVKRERSFEQLY